MNTFRLRLPLASDAPRPTISFPKSQASRKERGWGVRFRLHCDYELSTVNFKLAAPSRLPTLSRSSLAGGGTVPCSHRHRRKMVLASRLPAKKHGADRNAGRVFPVGVNAWTLTCWGGEARVGVSRFATTPWRSCRQSAPVSRLPTGHISGSFAIQ